jgi:hypothetical protein
MCKVGAIVNIYKSIFYILLYVSLVNMKTPILSCYSIYCSCRRENRVRWHKLLLRHGKIKINNNNNNSNFKLTM